MVVIREFVRDEPVGRRGEPSTTDCEFASFTDQRIGPVLELATTGSGERVSQGKRSQTIQLDERAGLKLLAIMEEVFGTEAMRLPTAVPLTGAEFAEIDPAMGPQGRDLAWSTDDVIDLPPLDHARLVAAPEQPPQYDESADGTLESTDPVAAPPRSPTSSHVLNRAIERSAIELVKRSLERSGWAFTRDRQRDGVGYDLEFTRAGDLRKVEVKGIRGNQLVFNLTPKELWRAEHDPQFVLVAVTGALDSRKHRLHVLSRRDVLGAHRGVLGYRVRPRLAAESSPIATGEDAAWH